MNRHVNANDVAFLDETLMPPNTIELRAATPDALYSYRLPVNELNLMRGNVAYQDSEYMRAIEFYTNALEVFARSPQKLTPPMMQAAFITLSNRAAAKLRLGDHLRAIPDLKQAIVSNPTLKKLTVNLRPSRLLIYQVFQLIKCYLLELELVSARRTWLEVDDSVWRDIDQELDLQEDGKKIASALNWLLAAEKRIDGLRFDKKWDQVLCCMETVERQGELWGLGWREKLPINWIRWKAEATAWLGFPEQAEFIAKNCFDAIPFDTPKEMWLRGLLAYSYGNLESAFDHFVKLNDTTKNELYAAMARRLRHFYTQITGFRHMGTGASHDGTLKISSLASHILNQLTNSIDRASRQETRLIYIERCSEDASKLEIGPISDHCIEEVIRNVDQMFSIDITDADRSQNPFPIRLRNLTLRCLLAKARVYTLRKASLVKSKEVYEEICYMLSRGFIDDRAVWLKVKEEYDAVVVKLNVVPSKVQTSSEINKLRQCYEDAMIMSKTNFGYYRVLGITPVASEREIKVAFRKESMVHHPDKGGLTAHFQLLTEIYGILVDRSKRDFYNWHCKMSQLRQLQSG